MANILLTLPNFPILGREIASPESYGSASLTELLGTWRCMIRKADAGIQTKESNSES